MVQPGGAYPMQPGPHGASYSRAPTPAGYDMTAAAARDALVRRVIWLALFIALAIAIAVVR